MGRLTPFFLKAICVQGDVQDDTIAQRATQNTSTTAAHRSWFSSLSSDRWTALALLIDRKPPKCVTSASSWTTSTVVFHGCVSQCKSVFFPPRVDCLSGTKWGFEFYRVYAVMQSCNPSTCIWGFRLDYKSSADSFCWKKDFSGFLHRGEQPFSLQLSAERVYTALIGLTTASPSFSLTVKHIKPETSFMI